MADSMTIGPVLAIGGNKVEMTQQGKIRVTNPEGKIKTLSQDEFKKQLINNADKINAGDDFEFKKDNKNLKIAGAVAGTLAAAYIGLSLAVGKGKLTKSVAEAGKELGFMSKVKNVFVSIGQSGVDLWKNTLVFCSKIKDEITGKKKLVPNGEGAKSISRKDIENELHRDFAKNADTINFTEAERKQAIKDAKAAFEQKK